MIKTLFWHKNLHYNNKKSEPTCLKLQLTEHKFIYDTGFFSTSSIKANIPGLISNSFSFSELSNYDMLTSRPLNVPSSGNTLSCCSWWLLNTDIHSPVGAVTWTVYWPFWVWKVFTLVFTEDVLKEDVDVLSLCLSFSMCFMSRAASLSPRPFRDRVFLSSIDWASVRLSHTKTHTNY